MPSSIASAQFWADVADRVRAQLLQVLAPFFALAMMGSLSSIKPLAVVAVAGCAVLAVVLKAVVGATIDTGAPQWQQALERAASAGAAAAAGYTTATGFSLLAADYRVIGGAVLTSALWAVLQTYWAPPAARVATLLAALPTRPPALGEHVLYTLTGADADIINDRRDAARQARTAGTAPVPNDGNGVAAGQIYPMTITRVWDGTPGLVQGQVHLDGNDLHWVTSVQQGTGPRTWARPATTHRHAA